MAADPLLARDVDDLDAALIAAWATLTAPGAPFEVGEVLVRDQALRCFVQAPETVAQIWAATRPFGEKTYLVFGEERVTYAQAHRIVDRVAGWLSAQGVGRGDRVAIAMRNYPEWMLIYWACMTLGVAAVGMNAWWVAEEMDTALRDARPKVVFCDAERWERLRDRPAVASTSVIVLARTPQTDGTVAWEAVIESDPAKTVARIDPDDDACIFYTSGTTGTPKGAQLTHRGCVNNLMNIAFGMAVQALASGAASADEPTVQAVALVTTPLFHVTANNCLAHPATAAGGALVLMRKWDAGEALRLIETERVTAMSGVPTMVRELLSHPDTMDRDLSSLASLVGGGAQVPPDLVARVEAFPSPVRPGSGYGMTELCGALTNISGEFFAARPESCGRILPTFEVRILGDQDEVLAIGETGELSVRGVGVIKGYLNRPEETADSIRDGWLSTGDIARLDADGYLYVVDRKKDMILRGGENVYCAEVEAALFRHPAVAEACAFAVADERLGEEVGAVVRLHPESPVTADDLRQTLAGLIARHKTPRYIWLVDQPLPRNASGKVLRRDLRDALSPADAG